MRIAGTEAHSATLAWDPPGRPNGPIDGYELAVVLRNVDEVTHWLDLAEGGPRFKVTDLQPSSAYTAYVRAYNLDENSTKLVSYAAVVTFRTDSNKSSRFTMTVFTIPFSQYGRLMRDIY